MGILIAIDGPSGTGKGSLSQELVKRYGFSFLDTGLLFRAMAFKARAQDIDVENEGALVDLALSLKPIDFSNRDMLRGEEIGQDASKIAVLPRVREALTTYMRAFAREGKAKNGVILDGRDIGTFVCPDADLKFFITASVQTRAERRFKELQSLGRDVIFETVLQQIKERDHRDQNRSIAPLKAADDAIHIDTSDLSRADVVDLVAHEINKTMA